jgi:glycosyltransferase involved in cell wall biosynthesis
VSIAPGRAIRFHGNPAHQRADGSFTPEYSRAGAADLSVQCEGGQKAPATRIPSGAITTSIDVAIPCYQYGAFLRECAASALSQPIPNLRLLIIDNASTDGSQEVAREIAAADSRVTLFLNEHNRGLHDSCNRAIDWAEADYFVLLDADDLLAAGSLARGLAFLDSHPEVAFLYGVEGRMVDGLLDPGRCDARTTRWNVTTGTEFIRKTCWDSFCDVGAPAVLVRTAAQKNAGHYRENLVRTFDFEMYLRLAMMGDVAHTNRVHGVRRMHPTQLTTPFIENPIRDFEEHELAFSSFFAHEGAALPEARDLQAMSRRKMGDYVYWFAVAKRIRGRSHAQSAFEFSASRRRKPKWLPPLTFLVKKRWVRSAWRGARRALHEPMPIPSSFRIPRYF